MNDVYPSRLVDGAYRWLRNLGETFGVDALLTIMSPDEKYMFFMVRREERKGVFWKEIKSIEEFKPD